jgi:uncharacterized protein YjbI with pentapeptide repeats
VLEQLKATHWRHLGGAREDDHDSVPIEVVNDILTELGYSLDDSPDILSSVLLNAMGTGACGNTAFLFGHKSFREYLAVRYHLSVFLFLAESSIETISPEASGYVEVIGRGDLMDYSEETREFQRHFHELPQLEEQRLGDLAVWCMSEAEDNRLVAPQAEELTLFNERRTSLRFAALGFCAALGAIHQHPLLGEQKDDDPPRLADLLTFHELRLRDARRSGESLVLTKADLRNIGEHVALCAYGADLEEANFFNAHAMHSCFNTARLDRADFQQALLRCAGMHGASLNGARFGKASLWGADFSDAKLEGADLRASDMSRLNFRDADLEEANFYGRTLQFTDFQGAKATRACFQNVEFHFCCFIDADLTNTNMQNTVFRHSQLGNANLCGADLRGADLEGVDLQSIQLETARYDAETKWPKAFNPTAAGAVFVETESS